MADIKKYEEKLNNMDDEQKAGLLYQQAVDHVRTMRVSTVMFALCMKSIKDNKYYEVLGYKTFDILCSAPEINIEHGTVKKYIKIIEYYIDKNFEINRLADISINNLGVMRNAKNIDKWIEPAKQMPYNDFKKEIYEKELGIKPEDKEIEKYIKEKKKQCEFWDGKGCIKYDKKN